MGIGELKDAFADQRVIDHHVGMLEAMERMKRQQAGIARPGARQPHPARLEGRQFQR